MIKQLSSWIKEKGFAETGFLLIATSLGYGFSYLYLLAMGRMLDVETYGILGGLFAIFYSFALIGQALMEAIAANIATIRSQHGEGVAISAFIKIASKLALIFLVPTVILLGFSPQVAAFFHLTQIGPVILLAIAVYAVLSINVVLGLLQGFQKFKQMGITGYLTAQGAKLASGILFVWLSWELMGAVGALLTSTTLGVVIGLFFLRKQLFQKSGEIRAYGFRVGSMFLPTLLMAVFLSVPASVDVMLVTHYMGGESGGIYNAVATLGKVIVFLPMAVSLILLPKVAEKHALGLATRSVLIQAIAVTLMLSGTVSIVLWIFPGALITLFFGNDYLSGEQFLGMYALAMLIFSVNVVLMHYSLATRRFMLMIMAVSITIAEVITIIFLHSSIDQVVWALLCGNLLIALIILPRLFLSRRPRNTQP